MEDNEARRRERHRNELERLVEGGQLGRAADLAHEHLCEFADDDLRGWLVEVLSASDDDRVRRRADEFNAEKFKTAR